MRQDHEEGSITLPGAVAMGTGVVIGAGIFALTGQITELAGPLFPLSLAVGALVTAFSAYTYTKMSKAYPSASGIGMILTKAYGPTTAAAGAALLMALLTVINESLVARTFGTCLLRAFDIDTRSPLVPLLGAALDRLCLSRQSVGKPFGRRVLDPHGRSQRRPARDAIRARGWVFLTAILLDAVVLTAFAVTKWQSVPWIVGIALAGIVTVILFWRAFLARNPIRRGEEGPHSHRH